MENRTLCFAKVKESIFKKGLNHTLFEGLKWCYFYEVILHRAKMAAVLS